jgi:DNA-binding transcriptional MocR family regulator
MSSVLLQIDHDTAEPVKSQIARAYSQAIRDGRLVPGSRLPSIRALAGRLKVSPATIVAAYRELSERGLAHASPRSAFCVAGTSVPRSGSVGKMNMNRIEPDLRIAPVEEFMKVLSNLSVADFSLGGYEDYRGCPDLRDRLAELDRADGIGSEPADGIIVTSGAQQALTLAARAFGIGARIAFENPCYGGARIAFSNAGAEIIPVACGQGGPLPEALALLSRPGTVDALYCCPTYGNPTGYSWNHETRLRVLEAAKLGGFMIIEDDFLGDLDYLGEKPFRLASLAREFEGVRVMRIRTFSKSLLPALRLAGVSAPPEFVARLLSLKISDDIGSSAILQRGLAAFIGDGRYSAHLDRVRPRYRQTREALRASLLDLVRDPKGGGFRFGDPPAGLCLTGTLPPDVDRSRFIAECARENILISSGADYWAGNSGGQDALRLGFGPLSPAEAALVGPAFLRAAARARELSVDHSFV